MTFDLTRRLAAEALGTFFLVMAIVGSGIMAQNLAGGNVALALLANMASTGAVLFVIIAIFISVSGAHFNPAVSLVMWVRGDLGRGDALAYIAVQILGGCLGAVAAHLMFGLEPVQFAQTARNGTGQWIGEFIATFGLIATILGCVRFNLNLVAPAVALYISSAYWFTSSTSFANPAVTIARAFTDTFSGIAPHHVPAFLFAEIAGALLAAFVMGWLLWPGATENEG
ncbi:MAG: aquaporin [Alphaproteobacteria bacterium]|jgi:glycerol uptake facilitator-like aquaporin|uniref:aquaporin n=1 Tax=Methyloceanibacter sp. TaxID=1965321 RepID=UPI00356B50F9